MHTEQVTSRLLVTAMLRLQQGDLESGLKLVEQGLAIAPADAGLQAVRDEAKRRLEEQTKRQAQIKATAEKLLALAEAQRAKSRLTLPPGDNAYETYRRILALDPTNQAAISGLKGMADDYLALAKSAADRARWSESVDLAGRGLMLAPAHPGLLALRAEALRKQGRRTAATQSRGTRPLAAAASQSQRAKPKQDPLAQQARRDVGRFIAGLHAKARQLQQQGRTEEAKRLVETGLRIAPGHPALLQLEKELQK
jgi:tetratricopeptide (TPR) repeat protein